MVRIKFTLLFLVINWSIHARTIDWQTGLTLIQQNNPEWLAANQTLESTRALEDSARSGFLPKLSGSISSSQSYGEITSNSSKRSESVALNLSQNLFSGFADLARYSEAKQNTRIAEMTWKQSKAKISYDYKSAYAGVVYAQEYVTLTQKILDRRKENLNIVQLRFNSGRENKGSVLLSEAYYQQAVYDSIQAGLQLDVAQNTLAQVLGLSLMDDKLVVVQDIPMTELAESSAIDFKKLGTLTLDYQKAMAQADAAKFTHDQNKAAYYPSLDLTGSIGKSDSVFPPENDRWSVGVSLTIPIFSGGRDYANELSARYRRVAAEVNRTTVSFQMIVKLKQAYSQFRLAIEKVKVDEKFKQAAQMRSEIAKKKYNNGLMSFDDWDVVENDLIQREKNSLTSSRDRVVGSANWDQAQGIGLWP
ncbi:MAG: TolC family protein [Bdellovibrionaceae bacterium]|nr:TolC family protein [Pseudobdellovibrionaceae bacterium]